MAAPEELGDRAAHRVADGDDAPQPELEGEGGDVVGALLESERPRRAQAAAVAAVVEGDDVEVIGERPIRRPPVQVGRGRPAVQQDDRRRPRRTGELAHERPTATREPHVAARRERPAVPDPPVRRRRPSRPALLLCTVWSVRPCRRYVSPVAPVRPWQARRVPDAERCRCRRRRRRHHRRRRRARAGPGRAARGVRRQGPGARCRLDERVVVDHPLQLLDDRRRAHGVGGGGLLEGLGRPPRRRGPRRDGPVRVRRQPRLPDAGLRRRRGAGGVGRRRDPLRAARSRRPADAVPSARPRQLLPAEADRRPGVRRRRRRRSCTPSTTPTAATSTTRCSPPTTSPMRPPTMAPRSASALPCGRSVVATAVSPASSSTAAR